jgi:hypothetical protein
MSARLDRGCWDLNLNFFSAPNLDYKVIPGLRHLTAFGGETISVAEGAAIGDQCRAK